MPYYHDYELDGTVEIGETVTVNAKYPFYEMVGKKMKVLKEQRGYIVCERLFDGDESE